MNLTIFVALASFRQIAIPPPTHPPPSSLHLLSLTTPIPSKDIFFFFERWGFIFEQNQFITFGVITLGVDCNAKCNNA